MPTDPNFDLGFSRGQWWAKAYAWNAQLETLARIQSSELLAERGPYTVAERFVFQLLPEASKLMAGDFWASVDNGNRTPSAGFVKGFLAGALAVKQKQGRG
jgi:hypothetical protein